jgi:hypothetical protein
VRDKREHTIWIIKNYVGNFCNNYAEMSEVEDVDSYIANIGRESRSKLKVIREIMKS